MIRRKSVVAAFAALVLMGCEADEAAFEQGADFDEPEILEEPGAPAVPDTTLPPIDPDTIGIEDI